MPEHVIIEGAYYRHYKHDPHGEPGNGIYEVLRVSCNYETKNLRVIYRPLYKTDIKKYGQAWFDRPVEEWFSLVEKGQGNWVHRYVQIGQGPEFDRLEKIRFELYLNDVVRVPRFNAVKIIT
jgi:hypothetical protein